MTDRTSKQQLIADIEQMIHVMNRKETSYLEIVPLFDRCIKALQDETSRDADDAARYQAIRSARVGTHGHCEIWSVAYVGRQLDEAVDAARGAAKTSSPRSWTCAVCGFEWVSPKREYCPQCHPPEEVSDKCEHGIPRRFCTAVHES